MKIYGLIGYPLSHSFSKKYFTEKFEKEYINNCEYHLYPIENINLLPQLIKDNAQLCGLNITIPYKESVISFLDELDPIAKDIGAVNTIKIVKDNNKTNAVIKNRTLIGYNTDAFGFRQSITPLLQKQHDKALILGTGGASKAVAYVLKELGIDYCYVSRTKNSESKKHLTYDELNESTINTFKLIINTSPVGTYPNISEAPQLPYQHLSSSHLLYDLVYNPEQTEFLKRGKQKGAATINGLTMLQQQAEEAWRIWNK